MASYFQVYNVGVNISFQSGSDFKSVLNYLKRILRHGFQPIISLLFQVRAIIAISVLASLCLNSSFRCNKGGVPKSICLPENYSKFELPFSDKPNRIGISIDIDEVLAISGKDYSITFATYFNVEWNERRLNAAPEFGASLKIPNSTDPVKVPMSLELINDLWVPNIFIYNLKTYKVISVLSKLAGLWIDTEKNVLYRDVLLTSKKVNSYYKTMYSQLISASVN